ncbi:hypothetical protein D3879_18710 [Pseudomonas cavernicola]|uniref:Uncharacterized protein n=1 Tax=Pseudomonas cavernicola TaxID=2320866 RepID=A0A418XC41_9PSED|nr:hypothetical protein [Pseudomonas cavernicola]RJG10075.1 hypothetical protein D3879_18710 [Pseudomonas cavernicola]
MSRTKDNVIHLQQWDPQQALERLNRLTGLRFAQWPESLVQQPLQAAAGQGANDFAVPIPTSSSVVQR